MHTILVVLATLFVCGFLLPPIVACFVYLWLAAWLTWPLPLFFAALWVSLWGSAWPIVSLILLLVIVSLGLLLRLWFAPEPGTDGEHSSGNIGVRER